MPAYRGFDSEARARSLGAGPITTVVSHSDAVTGLLEAADEHQADLLVLGNHQLAGAVGRLVGSPSTQVSSHTPTHPCPTRALTSYTDMALTTALKTAPKSGAAPLIVADITGEDSDADSVGTKL